MTIEIKIAMTSLVLWAFTHLLALPHTRFSDWGVKKFNSYLAFLLLIMAIYGIPALGAIIYGIWFKV